MSSHKILMSILGFAAAVEYLFPIGGFFMPEKTLALFKVAASPDTLFLTFIVSWLLLFVAIVCSLALWMVVKRLRAGWYLSFALGYWWIGIGISLAFVYQRYDHLLLDSLKGLIIVTAAHKSLPATRP